MMSAATLRRGSALAIGLLVLVLASGCNGGDTSGNDTSGTDDNLTAVPRYDMVPAAAEDSTPGRVQVTRGHDVGVHHAQLLIRVAWHSGEDPTGTHVDVHPGARVEVQVWSDQKAQVRVSSDPDAGATVAVGAPVAVDFTATSAPARVQVDGTTMVTLVAR